MNYWETFKMLCGEKGVSCSKAAEDMGFSRAMPTKWSSGSMPRPATIQAWAQYFGKDVSIFYKQDGIVTQPICGAVSMPVIGTVKAGYGGIAEEEYTGEYRLVTDIKGYSPTECRLLKVSGDSMYPLIQEGDTVLVHIQPQVESGEVAVVIHGEEATLKRVKILGSSIELVAANPEYKTRVLGGADLQSVRIYGKVLSIVHREIF